MKGVMNFRYNRAMGTGSSNYYTMSTSAVSCNDNNIVFVDSFNEIKKIEEAGQYSIYNIADWFLNKESMTQKNCKNYVIMHRHGVMH